MSLIFSQALLGAARMKELPPPPLAELQPTWDAIPAEDPAVALLQALALTYAVQRSGIQTAAVPAGEETPCPPESQPLLSSSATALMVRLLQGEMPELLNEGLSLAIASGRILPPRVLPELLSAGSRAIALRSFCRKLAGERGLWIARRRPGYAWLLEEAKVPESAWDEGQPAERLAWLRQTRAQDPERAAAAITSQWSGEEGRFRESIVALIAENPLPCDEQWLTLALKDRRQEVRDRAAIALSSIPGSAFRERAIARLRQHVRIGRKLLSRFIEVTPPSAFDPAWAADGIREKPPQGIGEKAWWLQQIAAALPLADWPAALGLKDGDLFSLSIDGDWRDSVLAAWVDSAQRLPQRSLPEHLAPFLATVPDWPRQPVLPPMMIVIGSLLRSIPAAGRYATMDKLAARIQAAPLLDLLNSLGEPPPPGEGKKSIAVLRQAALAQPTTFARHQARRLAACVPAEEIEAMLKSLASLPELTTAAEEFATTLEQRRLLHQNLNHPSPQ